MRYIDFLIEIGPDSSTKSHFLDETRNSKLNIDDKLKTGLKKFLDEDDKDWTKDKVNTFGEDLRKTLFTDEIANHFEKAMRYVSDDKGLRIMFNTDPAYAHYPWEAMSEEGTPMSIDKRTPIVRVFKGYNKSIDLGEQPLKILIIASNVIGLPYVNAEEEIKIITDEIEKAKAPIELDSVKIATKTNIENKIKHNTYNIIHFIGHGDFQGGKGYLALPSERAPRGTKHEANEIEIKNMFLNEKTVGLMVLNSCNTAEISKRFTGLVPKLIERVPAIISMRTRISYIASAAFARGLYLNLSGKRIEETIQEARQSMFNDDECDPRDFSIPVLYLGIDDEKRTVGSKYGALFQKSMVSAPRDTPLTTRAQQEPAVSILSDFYDIAESIHILQNAVLMCTQLKENAILLQPHASLHALTLQQFKDRFAKMTGEIEGKFPNTYDEINDCYRGLEQLQTCFSTIVKYVDTIDTTMKNIRTNIKNLYVSILKEALEGKS